MMGAGPDTLGIIEDVHDTFAVITWIYWGGHLAVTLFHVLMHHSTFSRMFDLSD
jgi:cytochrome b561